VKIAVHGLGYIGLPTAALFARSGLEVLGVDTSIRIVDAVRRGKIETREPDLAALVEWSVLRGGLRAAIEPEPADAHILCLPTPVDSKKRPRLEYIFKALSTVAPLLRRGNLIVVESTVPPGTTEMLADMVANLRPDLPKGELFFAHCPERAIPGAALREMAENERIIGGLCTEAARRTATLYRHISRARLHLTDARTAELCKLAENAWRDTTIGYANELSLICHEQGVDIWRLINLANRHPRVDRIEQALADPSRQARIACLGLAYKPDTDDLRESPSLAVAKILAGRGHRVLAVEPHINALPLGLADSGICLVSCETALADADAVAVLVSHSGFAARREVIARHPVVIDTVGLLGGALGDCAPFDEAGGRIENDNVTLAQPAQNVRADPVAMANLNGRKTSDPRIDPENRPSTVFAE
jgi:UDP-N-acetyl-D-mannosaminuronic acid dehydrogenase